VVPSDPLSGRSDYQSRPLHSSSITCNAHQIKFKLGALEHACQDSGKALKKLLHFKTMNGKLSASSDFDGATLNYQVMHGKERAFYEETENQK